jgi:hypothetical protein
MFKDSGSGSVISNAVSSEKYLRISVGFVPRAYNSKETRVCNLLSPRGICLEMHVEALGLSVVHK